MLLLDTRGLHSPMRIILECKNILQPENAANIFIWTAMLFLESVQDHQYVESNRNILSAHGSRCYLAI